MKNTCFHFLCNGVLIAFVAMLSACVDNNYDLSNIDTTTRLAVNELTVPFNVSCFEFDQILDADKYEGLAKDTVIQGEDTVINYYIKKEGSFSSDVIKVQDFTVSRPAVDIVSSQIDLYVPAGISGIRAYYDLRTDRPATFKAEAENFDGAIKRIDYIYGSSTIVSTLRLEGLSANVVKNVKIEGLVLQYPKGMDIADSRYDKNTGTYDLSNEVFIPNDRGEIMIENKISGVDAAIANLKIDYETKRIVYEDKVSVLEGRANIYIDSDMPRSAKFVLSPSILEIKATAFSGEIEYEVKNLEAQTIDLGEVPEFINQTGTNLSLTNPQIYLTFNNPVHEYGVYFNSGLQLETSHKGTTNVYATDELIRTSKTEEINTFVLSPMKPEKMLGGYEDATHVSFKKLSNVLADTDGIPKTIKVNATAPKMPRQTVEKFKLGTDLEAVKGCYTFYSKLDLNEGSTIVYTDTVDGWNDEDVDKIVIEKIKVDFDAKTELPLEAVFSVCPIELGGKVRNDVQGTSNLLRAYADYDEEKDHISIIIDASKNPIQHLDGVLFKTDILDKKTAEIYPNMKLYVKNLKVTITGYYDTEL